MGLMMEDDGKTMINPSIINHRMSSLTIYGTAVINDDQPGVGNCPILGILDITWKSSHLVDHIPNGWVMFNGDI